MAAVVLERPEIFDYIYRHEGDKEYSEDLLNRAGLQIAICLQFYSSVFNQHKNGVITDK